MGDTTNVQNISVEEDIGKRQIGKPRLNYENSTKINPGN
jgi:hypothetical protein